MTDDDFVERRRRAIDLAQGRKLNWQKRAAAARKEKAERQKQSAYEAYETAMAEKREYEAIHGPMRPQQGERR